MQFLKKYWFLILLVIAILLTINQCQPKEKIINKIEYIKVTDTIKEVIIEKPKTVYVEKIKTLKGKDSIIYKDKPSETTITANKFKSTLKSNNATANLEITTTGELLDVQGTIDYTQTNTTTTIIKPQSGAFIYFETGINLAERFELGVDYQIKNTLLIGVSADYNTITKQPGLNFKLGIRIFN